MKKYKPQKERIDGAFQYEYWWVTSPKIHGCRLMKVSIPPKSGPCSDWKYEFSNLEDLGTNCRAGNIHSQEEMKNWSWFKYIEEPKIKQMKIKLRSGKACKCSCRQFIGSDNRTYWVDIKNNIIYSTDCHKSNPIKAVGQFQIGDKAISQL